jgi:hypothetical protein
MLPYNPPTAFVALEEVHFENHKCNGLQQNF